MHASPIGQAQPFNAAWPGLAWGLHSKIRYEYSVSVESEALHSFTRKRHAPVSARTRKISYICVHGDFRLLP